MKLRRILSVALALLLALSLAVPAFADGGVPGNEVLTRGALISALYSLSNAKEPMPRPEEFADVPAYSELARALHWAVNRGIVNGYGNGKYGPDDPVTREQMATMLYRYAQSLGIGFQGLWVFPLDYPDASEISEYADEAMHWVVMHGIIQGTDKGIEPKALANRAQLALILQRWQKALLGEEAGEELWYSFDCVGLALKAPADLEFQATEYDTYIAKNDRIEIDVMKLGFVGEPDIRSLARFTEEATLEETEIIDRHGVELVNVKTESDKMIVYTVLSPSNDYYAIGFAPNFESDSYDESAPIDPELAMELKLIERSIHSSSDVPESGKTVRVFGGEQPELDYLVLVNKLNELPADWEDKVDIVYTTNSVGDTVEVERTAYKAYLELKADVAKEGIDLELDSARRSVEEQQNIMDRFIEQYGADYAAKTVAKPGYSEHHTGLALDLYFIINGTTYYNNEDMILRPDVWRTIHAKLADYGFILRYAEGKEHITGYGYEPWHIRYVGKEAARRITDRGHTLETYLAAGREPEVDMDYGYSNIYSMAERKEAAVQIKCAFAAWAGCELHSLRYAGDAYANDENLAWLNSLNPEARYTQAAMFLMDFHSPVAGGGAWEPNYEYTDYQWWLARTAGGGWKIVTMGY